MAGVTDEAAAWRCRDARGPTGDERRGNAALVGEPFSFAEWAAADMGAFDGIAFKAVAPARGPVLFW